MSSKDSSLEHEPSAESATHARARHIERAVAGAPLATMCVSIQTGRYVFANQAYADLVGRPLQELLDSDPYEVWVSLTSADDFARQRDAVGRIAMGEIDRFAVENQITPRGGPPRWIRSEVVGSRDGDGRLDNLTSYITDIDERRAAERTRERLEEQLRQTQKLDALGKLAGGVAHDFNNRLLVIIGYAELIKRTLPAESPLAEQADMVLGSAQRAAELSRQLLAYSRRQVLTPEAFDLNLTVERVRSLLERLIGEQVQLSTELRAEKLAFSDEGQIEQVILNLAINARDAMPEGGRLTLETADATVGPHEATDGPATGNSALAPGDYVKLMVTDTGTGISDEVLPHIFEPFFTTKSVGHGTGLGLSMVEGIVRQSGGAVRVATRVGTGTGVSVYLPRAKVVPEVTQAAAEPARRDAAASETVLVCDDDDDVRKLLVDVLGLRGYRTLPARDARSGLELAARHAGPVDLLVTDVVMPGMTGVELAAELRRRDPALRVLFLSGYTDEVQALSGPLGPHARFLAKPFLPGQLTQAVSALLEGRPASRRRGTVSGS